MLLYSYFHYNPLNEVPEYLLTYLFTLSEWWVNVAQSWSKN